MGSSVRAKGILQELRAALPSRERKMLDVRANSLLLEMPEAEEARFFQAIASVSKALEKIALRKVIPREVEDILSISMTERRRWLADGRLPSAGTRTVKLRGRARKITFHVFDPEQIASFLDSDIVSTWREQDAETAAENRKKAAWKAKLKRTQKPTKQADQRDSSGGAGQANLKGWEEFERDGPLR